MLIGRNREAKRAYGFDEIALVPGSISIDPVDVDVSLRIGDVGLNIPVLASAMDGAVGPRLSVELSRLGGLAVLNLDGLQTRYARPEEAILRIVEANLDEVIPTIQAVYREPIKPELVAERIESVKRSGAKMGVSVTPASAATFVPIAIEAGVDVIVLQATVTTAKHVSSRHESFSIAGLCRSTPVPVIVGNCVTYEGAIALMREGANGVLVGVGPGAACTTRRVLGIGVPQVTAIADVAAARDEHERQSGERVTVIADGGMRTGGDIAKAVASGADGVMIGSPIAAATEAPGKGHHWGMATSDSGLPRGTRIHVGHVGSLEQILLGPATKDDGTLNLVGALRNAMGVCGACNISAMHQCEIVVAPALPTEGKEHQNEQKVGMGN